MDKTLKQKLVQKLYEYRIENKLTLKQLSDELKLPLTTISSWLQKANNPSDIAAAELQAFLIKKGYDVR